MKNKKTVQTILMIAVVALVMKGLQVYGKTSAFPLRFKTYVDGKQTEFQVFNINGSNYFRLRELADKFSKTPAKFDIVWNDKKDLIELINGKNYRPIGREITEKLNRRRIRTLKQNSRLIIDGEKVNLFSYNIAGHKYFKLRDLEKYLNFEIVYNEDINDLNISTKKDYTGGIALDDLSKYLLEIEYDNNYIAYEYRIYKNGEIEALYSNHLEGVVIRDKRAKKIIESQLLTIDYDDEYDLVIDKIFTRLGYPTNYKNLEILIEFYSGERLRLEKNGGLVN